MYSANKAASNRKTQKGFSLESPNASSTPSLFFRGPRASPSFPPGGGGPPASMLETESKVKTMGGGTGRRLERFGRPGTGTQVARYCVGERCGFLCLSPPAESRTCHTRVNCVG